jgi:hypothetical protein
MNSEALQAFLFGSGTTLREWFGMKKNWLLSDVTLARIH